MTRRLVRYAGFDPSEQHRLEPADRAELPRRNLSATDADFLARERERYARVIAELHAGEAP